METSLPGCDCCNHSWAQVLGEGVGEEEEHPTPRQEEGAGLKEGLAVHWKEVVVEGEEGQLQGGVLYNSRSMVC